jgi:hypothetical protein
MPAWRTYSDEPFFLFYVDAWQHVDVHLFCWGSGIVLFKLPAEFVVRLSNFLSYERAPKYQCRCSLGLWETSSWLSIFTHKSASSSLYWTTRKNNIEFLVTSPTFKAALPFCTSAPRSRQCTWARTKSTYLLPAQLNIDTSFHEYKLGWLVPHIVVHQCYIVNTPGFFWDSASSSHDRVVVWWSDHDQIL